MRDSLSRRPPAILAEPRSIEQIWGESGSGSKAAHRATLILVHQLPFDGLEGLTFGLRQPEEDEGEAQDTD